MKCITAHRKCPTMPTGPPIGDAALLRIKLYYFFETAPSTMPSAHAPPTTHAKSWVFIVY